MASSGRVNRIPYARVVSTGAAVMVGGLFLPWLATGGGSGGVTYRGLEVPPVWIPTVTCAALSSGFAVAWWRWDDRRHQQYAALAAGFLLLYLAMTLVVIEVFSDLLPTSLLPL